MASIFDTAKYILESSGPVSPIRLQKLCYYSQAWSLAWDKKPLFDEFFDICAIGPICVDLLRKTYKNTLADRDDIEGNPDNLSTEQKETINLVLNHYGKYNSTGKEV